MYVHVGEEVLVRSKEIIAVINKDSYDTTSEMEEIQQLYGNKLFDVAKGSYKSIIVTENKVYLSPFASGTILKRSV